MEAAVGACVTAHVELPLPRAHATVLGSVKARAASPSRRGSAWRPRCRKRQCGSQSPLDWRRPHAGMPQAASHSPPPSPWPAGSAPLRHRQRPLTRALHSPPLPPRRPPSSRGRLSEQARVVISGARGLREGGVSPSRSQALKSSSLALAGSSLARFAGLAVAAGSRSACACDSS